jgi:hypothetical protein
MEARIRYKVKAEISDAVNKLPKIKCTQELVVRELLKQNITNLSG